jgi:hypothetical protein
MRFATLNSCIGFSYLNLIGMKILFVILSKPVATSSVVEGQKD